MLGVIYDAGTGVLRNEGQAAMWYRKAAEQGLTSAQFNLGKMYNDGQGVPQDYRQAVAWFRKAAEQGEASAQFNLGMMYSAGNGVRKDDVEAHKWRSLAADGATGENQKRYAEVRDSLAKGMTHAQLAEAQKRASEWVAAFEKRKK